MDSGEWRTVSTRWKCLAGTQGWSAKYDAEKTIPLSDRKL
jgi:hypothetical protein